MTKTEYRDAMLKIWGTAQNLSDNVDSLTIIDYHQVENKIDRLVVDLISDCKDDGVLTSAEAQSEFKFCAKLSRAVHFACLSRVAWEYHYKQVVRAE